MLSRSSWAFQVLFLASSVGCFTLQSSQLKVQNNNNIVNVDLMSSVTFDSGNSHRQFPSKSTMSCLFMSEDSEELYTEDEEDEGYEFILTPTQVKTLRKESDKRRIKEKLKFYSIPKQFDEDQDLDEDELDARMDEIISGISDLFAEDELVEVRNISPQNRKNVKHLSEVLSWHLEGMVQRPVVVLTSKGHKAVMYSPSPDLPNSIRLFQSYEEGKFNRKPKPIRDNRGQIIKDEDGKTIRV